LLLPSLLLIRVFSYYPAVRSLIGGLYQWTTSRPRSGRDFSQSRQYLQSPVFGTEVKNIAILVSLVSQFTAVEIVARSCMLTGCGSPWPRILPGSTALRATMPTPPRP
jgi:ABC-type sugar transport system permease subunit